MSTLKHEYRISDLVIDDEYGTILANASVEKVAQKMKELGVPDLVVLDEKSEKVLGVIGDFDIVKNVVAEGGDPKTTTAKQAMFVIPPVTLQTPVTEAFALMQKLNANVVPVVEKDKLVGVASTYDVWNFIPEVSSDEIGWIPVKNPKNAEFWFSMLLSTFALLFLLVLPLSGIIGYFNADAAELADLLGWGDLRAGNFKFTLFEAHSRDLYLSIFELAKDGGFWWVLTAICSIFVVLFGFIGIFSILYASYSDMQNYKTIPAVRTLFPWLFVGIVILEWVLYAIALSVGQADIVFTVDIAGLILQLLGLIFIIGAIFRDYLFREDIEKESVAESEVQ